MDFQDQIISFKLSLKQKLNSQKNNKQRTKLSDIGEFELINRLSKDIKISNNSTLLGIGDDSAILNFDKDKVLVSSDMLVEGVHFDLSYMPLKHLGYKAVVSNAPSLIYEEGDIIGKHFN